MEKVGGVEEREDDYREDDQCDVAQVEDLYQAMRCFDDLMNSTANHIKLKMEPGTMRLNYVQ